MSSDEQPRPGATPPPPPGGRPPWQGGHAPGVPVYGPPSHPQATTALVLGIIGISACGLTAPFAWVIGGRAVREIDADPTAFGGRSEANAGRVMGIVGTVILALALLFLVALLVVAVVGVASIDESYTFDRVLGTWGGLAASGH